ncbi:MAG: UDP-N-acetylglucosamine 2-epimerase (non-hydrolyzing) [Candidatus Melainabacteria bacterium]|nr:MAG: UDP-N-acetylglucosamine 2-epimerase (non-hydrolyzing) [Candidatus Melainabacteria bacterium]
MKKRIMCVFGTRPEAVKMAPVVHALQKSQKLEPVVVSTAQHREMLDQMIKWFQLKPAHDLDVMRHGQSLAGITARVLEGMDGLLNESKPDLLLVQGDTITVMAAALAAFYHKIPVGHVEAGLRTDNLYNPFPEEMSRRQVSQIATLHFAPTKLAVENLKRSGITENVYMTGNTVIDALLDTANRLTKTKVEPEIFGHADFDKYKVLLVTAHRRENWGEGMDGIAGALRELVETYPQIQVLYPIHKNPIVRQSIEPIFANHDRLVMVEPLDYVPFVYAMQRSFFVLTDSGGIQEEAPSLGKPVLVMRTTTERPEAMEAGAARLVGIEKQGIVTAAKELLDSPDAYGKMSKAVNPFGDGKASERIVSAIEEYLS